MISCNKDIVTDLETPTFDVTTSNTTFTAGEPVTFLFTGEAHTISFYSGETFNDYDFRDGRIIDVTGAGATMEFASSVQVGTQTNQLSILASTDFNGDYSSLEQVKASTWMDITNRFVLGTNATFQTTDAIITDLTVAGRPIYIAYKYVTKPQATNGLARQWYIQSFAIKSIATLTSTASNTPVALTLADQIYAGFRIVDNSPTTNPALSTVTTTRITLWGNEYRIATLEKYDPTLPKWDITNPMYDPNSSSYDATAVWTPYVPFDPDAPDNDPASENWAVSGPIGLNSINLGPDYPTVIKAGISASTLTDYSYTYAQPGTYKAVFVGFNSSIDETKTVVKEMTVTVTP